MSRIAIVDLEVNYHIGVTDAERAQPQRLLITVELNFDFSSAVRSDRVEKTINYQNVADDLLRFGEGRSWKLLERLVTNIADEILNKYKPQSLAVEVKKFIIPQARYVSASVARSYS
jgi:7,8-dihydroneopterin aldolase/epimerase/oxygenase